MLFSISIGSRGEGTPSYTLRLPFILAPGRILKLEEQNTFSLLGQASKIVQENKQYTLIVSGFASECSAKLFLTKACAGLIWYGLKNSVGIKYQVDINTINLFDEAAPIAEGAPFSEITNKKGWSQFDGDFDLDKTVIVPEHKRLLIFTAGNVSIRIDSPVSTVFNAIQEGMAERGSHSILEAPKLRLACEVYLSSHFENSAAATFLSRITTLEILIADTPASKPVQNTVEELIRAAETAKNSAIDDETRKEYTSVLSRLKHLRNRSIKSGIRTLITKELSEAQEPRFVSEAAQDVARLYDLRSALVHTGEAQAEAIAAANARLGEIVPLVLKSLFRGSTLASS